MLAAQLTEADRDATHQPEPAWRPDQRIEQVRRYAQSTDDRERAIAGQHADTVRAYEQGLRDHLAAGHPLPNGVMPPLRQRY